MTTENLPDDVQKCLQQLANQFGQIALWGSYLKGNWADDSDLDVRIKEPKIWAKPIAQNIGNRWGLKIDVFAWSENSEQFIIESNVS